ncbi:MAG: DUF523 domain-containing protein [Clostridia bacterium]|nr:DUF523 domain-containing protein [Clostridia bacterium]
MIIVSACLAGYRCRYDGKTNPDESVVALVKRGEAIPVCPEMLGGLPCPRIPSERTADGTRVLMRDGSDVTGAFKRGAEETLRMARLYGCDRAILKARSPSCGCGTIYDGTFSGTLREGSGVTAELLMQNGVPVEVKD